MTNQRFCAYLALAFSLVACGKKAPQEPAKSLNYFLTNVSEAKKTAQDCLIFEGNDLSTMSPTQQQAWRETTAGINCENAKQAASLEDINARQRALLKNDEKYK